MFTVTADRDAEATRHLAAIQTASDGLLRVEIVALADLKPLLDAADAGNQDAVRIAGFVAAAAMEVAEAPDTEPLLCACCSASVRVGTAFAVCLALPPRSAEIGAAALVLCETCTADPTSWQAKAEAAMRRVWPDSRIIPNHGHKPGHA